MPHKWLIPFDTNFCFTYWVCRVFYFFCITNSILPGKNRYLKWILVTAGNSCCRETNLPISGLGSLINLLYPLEGSKFIYPYLVKFMFRQIAEETITRIRKVHSSMHLHTWVVSVNAVVLVYLRNIHGDRAWFSCVLSHKHFDYLNFSSICIHLTIRLQDKRQNPLF